MSEIKVCSDASGCFSGGLSATEAILTPAEVKAASFIVNGGTSSQFLKADGTTDASTYTTCLGDITTVNPGAALSGGGFSGDVTIGLDASAGANWDQSGCAGLNCVGDITDVLAGPGIEGGGSTGGVTVCVDNTCLTEWNGTTTTVRANSGTWGAGGGGSDVSDLSANWEGTYTTVQSNSGNWDQSGCSGLNCVGDITGVTAGFALTGGGTFGQLEIGLDSACNTNWDQSGCAGIDCVGTVTGTGTTNTIPKFCASGAIADSIVSESGSIVLVDGSLSAADGFCSQENNHKWGSGSILESITTGTSNIAIGDHALSGVTSGCYNIGIGEGTTAGGDTNCHNIGIGYHVLQRLTTGNSNTGVGFEALDINSSGCENSAFGYKTLSNNTTGFRNTAIGFSSSISNSNGIYNVSNGYFALGCNTSGQYNIAHGRQSLFLNKDGGFNISLGTYSLQCAASGDSNFASGLYAMQEGYGAFNSVGIGAYALRQITEGSCNVAIGRCASCATTTGDHNIAIGFCSIARNTTPSHNIGIGCGSGTFLNNGTTAATGVDKSIYIGCGTRACLNTDTNTIVLGHGTCSCGSNTAMIGDSNITVVCSHGTFSTVSDRRDKTCICDLELGLEFIGDLKPKTFNMITDRDDPEGSISCKRYGFIAQDILALEGDDNVIISTKNSERLGITETNIIPILVKGMQEQQDIIKSLEARIDALEAPEA